MMPLISTETFPDGILSALANRDISLWIHTLPNNIDTNAIAELIRLPWHEVFLSTADPSLISELGRDSEQSLLRKRGFIQVIQTNPLHISLPPRSLPVYVLDSPDTRESRFDRTLRRISMLGALRRSSVRRLLVITKDGDAPPEELSGLLDSSFYPYVTFASNTEVGISEATRWSTATASGPPKTLVRLPPFDFVTELIRRYFESYIDESILIRMRTVKGSTVLVDLSEVDDLERPILTHYDLIRERDLAYVSPEELTEGEFAAFFEGQVSSWRPYAARVPWIQNDKVLISLKKILSRLNNIGSSENKIAYIVSEPGAGGTTLSRQLAWEAAGEGYPTLVAKAVPFSPEALPVVGFLNRTNEALTAARSDAQIDESRDGEGRTIYEPPWVIVFDRSHWEQKDGELRRFLSELERSGRPVVLLVVIGPVIPLSFYNETVATELTVLKHIIDSSEARQLGLHLNRYLRGFGKERPPEEWVSFHNRHAVQSMGSRASFWIALSFWLRATRNFDENLQEWLYKAFRDHARRVDIRNALIEIAALSSQRLPLNERLLPASADEWPLSLHLEDNRQHLSALGLVRLTIDGEKYWGLAHDILGRLLINALFYDHTVRTELNYEKAIDPEHLRFLALKRIAIRPEIAELTNRALAEEFATTIFKIDPDHGARIFVGIWREVLHALDEMPTLLRDGSRVFRHHTAISRRRIAMLEGTTYNVTTEDQLSLLHRAVDDIQYAIQSIERMPGDEPNLNLFNSLANAYLNLADVKTKISAPREEIKRLRDSANDATHSAYRENPTSPFVVETHIRNLISIARSEPDQAVSSCLEALQTTYEALRGDNSLLRTPQLARLAQQTVDFLFTQRAWKDHDGEPRTAIDVLLLTWGILCRVDASQIGEHLSELPIETADEALAVLEHPAGRGDIQVLRLRYGILSAARAFEFRLRVELLEALQATDVGLSPQLRLEYALLLYQVGRAVEGDERFRDLRRLWRNSEHFVRVPKPLDWLREGEFETPLTVQAVVESDQSHRSMAKVREFGNRVCPFRPEEFDVRFMHPGRNFRARVSFGHNGPFLRPLGAQPRRS